MGSTTHEDKNDTIGTLLGVFVIQSHKQHQNFIM